jgi:homopolymeric O-antigen transport system permease protein
MAVADGSIPIVDSPGNAQSPGRPSIARDLAESARDIVQSRGLLYQLALRDVRIRYKQAVMGFGWAVFMPVVIVSAGCLVRVALARGVDGAVDRSILAALAVKALPWAFVVGAIGFATPSLTNNINLVSKVYFPREVLPLAALLAQTFDTVVGATLLAILLPALGIAHVTALVWVPLLALLLFMLTAAACLFLSCANLFFRDVKYIVQVVITFSIFFTPVLFEPSLLGPRGARLVMLNPVAPLLEGLRLSVVDGHNLLAPLTAQTVMPGGLPVIEWAPWWLAYSACWAVAALLASVLIFHRSESIFADYV